MTRRSAPAPIAARRLSLPFSRLPTLLPKPSIAKRAPETQITGPNGVINVHRINAQNVVLSSAKTPKGTLRPLPALNKVGTISTAKATNQIVLRKSMPPPTKNIVQPAKVLTQTPTIVSIKRSQIARLPPTLKPAPRIQLNGPFKTYGKTPEGVYIESPMPVISKVLSIDRMNQKNGRAIVANPPKQTESTPTPSQATEKQPSRTDVVLVQFNFVCAAVTKLFKLHSFPILFNSQINRR